jgi:hypothetical protein
MCALQDALSIHSTYESDLDAHQVSRVHKTIVAAFFVRQLDAATISALSGGVMIP